MGLFESYFGYKTRRKSFNEWIIAITELNTDDNVKFRSFQENAFWRMIDYAMSDDFPTVNTDLKCWVNGKEIESLPIDISFNLPIENKTISLSYKPLHGEVFTIPQTAPLSSQVAWKLHQTIVRPRFKDIFDLTYLLKHPYFNDETLQQTLQTLVNECYADNISIKNLEFMIDGNLGKLFPNDSIKRNWDYWRFLSESYSSGVSDYGKAEHITSTAKLTQELSKFEEDFRNSMINAGFTFEIIENLPQTKTPQTESPKNEDSFFNKIKSWFS